MARNTSTPPEVNTNTLTQDSFANVEDLGEALEKFMEEWGPSGAHIKVERQDEKVTSKWYIVGAWPIADFSVDVVQENGGGQYRGRVFSQKGSSKYFYFAIDPRIKPRSERETAPAVPSAVSSELSEIKTLLRDTIQAIAKPPASSADRIKETLELLASVRDVLGFSPATGKTTTPGDAVDVVAKAFERGLEAGAKGSVEDIGYATVIREVGGPLVQLAREYLQRVAPPLPTRPAMPRPGGAPPSPQPPKGESMGFLDNAIRVAVSNVVTWANEKQDPVACAAAVLEQIPQAYYRMVYDKVNDPGFPPYLFNQFPALREHEEWVNGFLAGMREQLHLEPEETADAVEE